MNDFRLPDDLTDFDPDELSDDDLDTLVRAITDFFDGLTEWIVEFVDTYLVPIMDSVMEAVDNVAEAHGMTRDEFIAALQRETDVIEQVHTMDERKFTLEDDSARWN